MIVQYFKKISRKLVAAIILVYSLSLPIVAMASDDDYDQYKKNNDTKYEAIIDDQADLLTSGQERTVLDAMMPITDYCDVAFVSIDHNSSSTRNFAEQYLHRVFGRTGIVFVIDMDNREIFIYSDGSAHSTITDSYAYSITDNIYGYASDKKYSICAVKAFEQINNLFNGKKIAQPMKYICNALLAASISMFVCFLFAKGSSKAQAVSGSELLKYTNKRLNQGATQVRYSHTTKVYNPPSSSSGGGGGHSGGGGGGGHSGGGGGHRF